MSRDGAVNEGYECQQTHDHTIDVDHNTPNETTEQKDTRTYTTLCACSENGKQCDCIRSSGRIVSPHLQRKLDLTWNRCKTLGLIFCICLFAVWVVAYVTLYYYNKL